MLQFENTVRNAVFRCVRLVAREAMNRWRLTVCVVMWATMKILGSVARHGHAFVAPISGPRACSSMESRLIAASLSTLPESSTGKRPRRVAIVGGGLAGLSTAFHMLEQSNKALDLTIIDTHQVGVGGASAVAGGLLHPLSPRGKLVHWGREGLEATNDLIDQACTATKVCDNEIVVRSEIFRIATSSKQADQLKQTARELSDLCKWSDPHELPTELCESIKDNVYGALRLYNGCKVLHVPSYLRGLWAACQAKGSREEPVAHVRWQIQERFSQNKQSILEGYDTIVLAAGAGLFGKENSRALSFAQDSSSDNSLPVQLVRGQSMEIRLRNGCQGGQSAPNHALLSGKYVSPLPDPDLLLVGATHEFQRDAMSYEEVKHELQERTHLFCPAIWGEAANVERFTSGLRVQSQRGAQGRLPIIGKLDVGALNVPAGSQKDVWIFTGLSSRGLLYHGIYGKLLAQAILQSSEECLTTRCPGFDWWRRREY